MRFDVNEASDDGRDPYDFHDSVMNMLGKMGITGRDRPVVEAEHAILFKGLREGEFFDGRLPTVIRNFDIDQLSDLHAIFSAWFAYVTFQAKFVEAQVAEARGSKERILVLLKKKYREEGHAAALVGDFAKAHKTYIDADAHYLQLKILHECLEAAVNIADQDLKTISREVTREKMKLEAEINKNSMSGRTSRRFSEPAVKGSSSGIQRKYGKRT